MAWIKTIPPDEADPELREALEEVQREHRENLRRAARELFPEAAALPDFDAALDVVLSTMQGASLGALVLPDPAADARRLAFLEGVARSVFDPRSA